MKRKKKKRDRFERPYEGICYYCGTTFKKIARVPLDSIKCPKCETYSIVKSYLMEE